MTLLHNNHRALPTLADEYTRLAKDDELWQTSLKRAMLIVAAHSQSALRVARCGVWLYQHSQQHGQTLNCQAFAEGNDLFSSEERCIQASDYPAYFKALEGSRVICADNAQTDPRTQCLCASYLTPNNVTSLLDATLHTEGAACGVICFEHTHSPRQWQQEEINFATSVADLLSQLIMYYSLRNSEMRYRTVFDSTGDALIIICGDVITDCNAAALQLFRCNRQQFIGQPATKLWQLPIEGGTSTYSRFEWLQTRWDNTEFYADVSITRTRLEQQEHLVASVRDISDRKNASDQLKALNSLHQAIFDGTNYCIIATDLNGVIHTFNRAAEYHLRYSAEDVIDQHSPLIFHSEKELIWRAETLSRELGYELSPNFEALVAKARLGEIEEYEWQYLRKDNTELPVSGRCATARPAIRDLRLFVYGSGYHRT